MRYDYVVLYAGPEMAKLAKIGRTSKSGYFLLDGIMPYLAEMAMDLDYRRQKLLFAVAQVQSVLPADMYPSEDRASLQRLIGDVAMNLFNSVDDLLGTHTLLPAPGTRHLLSDYKYHGLCEQGVILARPVITPQSF